MRLSVNLCTQSMGAGMGSVAQIGMRSSFPLRWTESSDALRDRGSECCEAVQDRGADLELCNLAVEVA